MLFTKKPLAIALLLSLVAQAQAQTSELEEMVVIGAHSEKPLMVATDPKAPRQPLPAHDGADYLKTLPGFSVIRKGGTGGDPVFRGMAGSRLNLSIDGEAILGGCSNRMDPPTAYVFPENFDRITLIKGPQSVQYGPGSSAGVVLFEREDVRLNSESWEVQASALGGSFGRQDVQANLAGGNESLIIEGSASHAQQDDYRDGDNNEVHSQYKKWTGRLALGWTPNDNTLVQISTGRSDGEAAYADRGVDGSLFARDSLGAKVVLKTLTAWLDKLELQAYENNVDHVMDNYTLRSPAGMMATPMAMNPSRDTQGAKIVANLSPGDTMDWLIGADWQQNQHANRQSMNQNMVDYESLPRVDDAAFEQQGLFTELSYAASYDSKILAGLRVDQWQATDLREQVVVSMMMQLPNPSAGETREETLMSGFARIEQELHSLPATAYIGLGHAERFPDYWELISKESLDSVSAFDTESEKTTQLDFGVLHKSEQWQGSVSAFYNDINDYLLIQNSVTKPAGMMGSRSASVTRNVDVRSWGLEADGRYMLNQHWSLSGSLAAVKGINDTDATPLAQLPPLETRIGLHYQNLNWALGALWRITAKQSRVDPSKGNIAGQDIGPSDGFQVLSLNALWKPNNELAVSAGIDNILNQTYAEHISRASADITGFEQTTRVNEPGRTLWLKAQMEFN